MDDNEYIKEANKVVIAFEEFDKKLADEDRFDIRLRLLDNLNQLFGEEKTRL